VNPRENAFHALGATLRTISTRDRKLNATSRIVAIRRKTVPAVTVANPERSSAGSFDALDPP
jgi:hypothetical protein